ncbi:hypothetical protein CEXT_755401 [Caerostris extrusa]|uniref:Uncharacterized protein n=1 Tax=Caerostris extrusa TaxID=172846 RepID=A0AAV4PYI0_CAEEX|nr:hypothetical protein CEXT_755401 [Caerostris extrusa]
MKHSLDGEWAKLRKNIAFIPFLSSSKDRFGVYFPPRTIFLRVDYRLQEDWNKSRKKATIFGFVLGFRGYVLLGLVGVCWKWY